MIVAEVEGLGRADLSVIAYLPEITATLPSNILGAGSETEAELSLTSRVLKNAGRSGPLVVPTGSGPWRVNVRASDPGVAAPADGGIRACQSSVTDAASPARFEWSMPGFNLIVR